MEISLKTLQQPRLGMNVIAQESSLPPFHVRSMHNVVTDNTGQVSRRPGYQAFASLTNAHSLWHYNELVLVASENSLYRVNLSTAAVTEIFSGLPEAPVEYSVINGDVYFCAPGVLGKITASGLVRKPGVASLLSSSPILTATVGGLPKGKYGVAFSLVNDLGEESGLSSIAFIELPAGCSITISGLLTASHVSSQNIYVSAVNSGEMYLHHNQAVAGTSFIGDQTMLRKATKQYLEPMPGGNIVRHFRGRTYVADGPWLWVSEPLDYGLYHFKTGFMAFNWTITMMQPVVGGIFLGGADRVVFLDGTGPGTFNVNPVSDVGVVSGSGTTVPPYFFSPDLVSDQTGQVAVWLSDVGIALGHNNGSVSYPQLDRIRLSMTSARPAFMIYNGVTQAVFLGEAVNFLGAVDSVI